MPAEETILITGCSTGIGRATAERLVASGHTVYATARNLDSVSGLEAKGCRTMALDVTDETSMEAAVARIDEEAGGIGALVNNAGYSQSGAVETLDMEALRRQFETNVFGVLETIQACLPQLRKTRGRLVLIGSVAGYISAPGSSPYSMSKFAIRALAEALGPELRSRGVAVTLISPGFVASEIRQVDNRGVHHAFAKEPLPPWLVMRADVAARKIVSAAYRRRREAVVTMHGKALLWLQRFAPWVLRFAARRGVRARSEPRR